MFESLLAGHSYTEPGEVMGLVAPVGWALVAISLLELWLAYRLPERKKAPEGMQFDWSAYGSGRYLRTNLSAARRNPVIWLSIIGLSVFWAISQVILAVFPAFAKEHLEVTNTVVIQGMLASSGIGIIVGSLIAGKNSTATRRDRADSGRGCRYCRGHVCRARIGFRHGPYLNFFLIGMLGGFFMVPLNSLIQFHAGERALGRVLAANNFVQNLIMLGFLGLTVLSAFVHSGSMAMIGMLGFVALGGAVYTVTNYRSHWFDFSLRG